MIELLTVIAIIGVLSSLALSSFSLYRASAAYAVANQTLHDARNALEASLVDPDNLPASGAGTQNFPGEMTGPGKELLIGLKLPKDMSIDYLYSQECLDSSCEEAVLETRHCKGREFSRWTRFGDGIEVLLEHVAGAGCP